MGVAGREEQIHAVEYYTATKRNELDSEAGPCSMPKGERQAADPPEAGGLAITV